MFLHQKYGEGLCWVKDESIVKSSLMPVSAIYKTNKLGVVLENKNYYKAKNGPNLLQRLEWPPNDLAK